MSQSAPPAPAFEVASVNPTSPVSRDSIGLSTYPGGRIKVTKFTLNMLIQQAYGVNQYQVSGGPRWVDQDRFDIVAKPPESSEASKFNPPTPKTRPTQEQLLMLQTLLADRFHLKIHKESKEGPAYAMLVAAKGARLSETKNHDAYRYVGGGRTGNAERPDFINGENASMAMLATRLADYFRCPVLDRTGLRGDFDFKVEFAADEAETGAGPSLIPALQEQLGLKLVATKAPGEALVIDHAEKPAGN
jgi:uncharacterized protein (TIGR03435 family)